MKKVTIKISNKAIYSLLTIFIIAAVAVNVFAYGGNNPSIMGHSAGEIDGVCRSDGVGCGNYQDNLGLHIRESDNALCYETTSASGCTLESATCSATGGMSFSSPSACSLSSSAQDSLCSYYCSGNVVCDGDITSFSCGTPGVVYYTSGTVDYCEIIAGEDILFCQCTGTSGSYQREVADNLKCLV